MRERIQDLDILRGFAATGVAVTHLCCLAGLTTPNIMWFFTYKGYLFVPLFFAISSFSLAYTHEKNLFDEKNLKNFFVRRFFRIIPLFWLALLVEFLLFKNIFHAPFASLKDIFLTFFFIFPLVPGHEEGAVWSGWSVGIEMIFYMIFPAIMLFINNKKSVLLAWAIFFTASITLSGIQATSTHQLNNSYYINLLNHMIYFISGLVIYIYFSSLKTIKEKLKDKASLVSVSIILFICLSFFLYHKFFESNIPYQLVYSICWSLLICSTIIGFPKFFKNKLSLFCGKSSYSIYLIHPITLALLKHVGLFSYMSSHFNPQLAFIFSAILFLSVTFGISYLTYSYIEKPFIRLSKKTE